MTRPTTLVEVAARALAGDDFDRSLANFLDEFASRPIPGALAAEPPRLAPSDPGRGDVRDAYLAAVAEELARQHALATPSWTGGAGRSLRRPWFASPLAALRAVLLLESPPSFRARNLFVSANALSRA